jgi:hypothetical protein
MFSSQQRRLDFADTRAAAASESVWALTSFGRLEGSETVEALAQAEAADRQLLRLVVCAAAATLLLALASSLGA